jgi:hypothetical protein
MPRILPQPADHSRALRARKRPVRARMQVVALGPFLPPAQCAVRVSIWVQHSRTVFEVPAWPRVYAGRLTEHRLSWEFGTALGFWSCLVLAASFSAWGTALSPGWALGCMALLVAAVSWWTTGLGAVVTAGLGWLFLTGFGVDRFGALRWHGYADVERLVLLLGGAFVAVGLHLLYEHVTASTEHPHG